MTMPSNFRTYLTPEDLEALRKLSKHLHMTLQSGQLQGEGSPRQLLIALAAAVQRDGVKRVAAAIAPIITPPPVP